VASSAKDAGVAALVRDPCSSMQVWSRHQGYPGDEWYLEFHKIRWPGGLKLWRVTGSNVDLGAKRGYEPAAARGRDRSRAAWPAERVRELATVASRLGFAESD
jgi:1,4-alpha-glucan branching enzyme